MSKTKTLLFWSSGKDSAWALHVLNQGGEFQIAALVTTINQELKRVPFHSVKLELLEAQAYAAGLPLWPIPIPHPCSNAQYETALQQILTKAKEQGISVAAFGDLFLEDIKQYREKLFAGTGISLQFPIWEQDTSKLAAQMIDGGLKARIISVDQKQLSPSFIGKELNHEFLKQLPHGVDSCGERGEFHTFAYGGPMFAHEIPIINGAVSEKDGFSYLELSI
ncbi:MAG TPA: ATP-binding protein [Acidobacteriota bacterium]|nr:ATP-binding protein [Acidobacteriota bacterium]